MKRDLAGARAMWREIVATIRTSPVHEARKLVDEMLVDLDSMFPLPAPTSKNAEAQYRSLVAELDGRTPRSKR
jgi:hypothetical protein